MNDYDTEINDAELLNAHDEQAETKKNVKLLNEIIVAQAPTTKPNSSKKKKIFKKTSQFFESSFANLDILKILAILAGLYVLLHTRIANNTLIRYLPKKLTDPSNVYVYYGTRGMVMALLFYGIKFFV